MLTSRDRTMTERPRQHAGLSTLLSVQTKPVSWLWPAWIPLGKITVIDGDPGLGKSTLLLDLAARVSRDDIMPDGSRGQYGDVLLLTAEDSLDIDTPWDLRLVESALAARSRPT